MSLRKPVGHLPAEVFARAAERYLDELEADSVIDRINAALDAAGGTDKKQPRRR